MSMQRYRAPVLVGAALLGLTACGGGNNNTPPLTGAVRVANGITDSTGLNMSIGDSKFTGIALGTASNIAYVPVNAVDSYKADLASNGASFTVDGIGIRQDKVTTVFTFGEIAAGTEGGFYVQESLSAPASGQAVVQPLHAALTASTTAATLNFYFVTPGACATALNGAAVNGSAVFKIATASSFTLAGGTYEICVTDTAGTVLFDSGPKGIALPTASANVFQIAAYDAPTGEGNGSGLILSILDNNGGSMAAGCGNNTAVQYHFGTKDQLIQAVFEYRQPQLHERRRILIAQHRPHDLRSWCECFLLPILEQ